MSDEPYGAPSVEPDPYTEAWASFQRRRRFLEVVASFVLVAGVDAALDLLGGHPSRARLVLVLATLAGLFLLTRYPLKCPRCRANFYRGLVGPFAETNRCAHCRIKIGTTKADADEADRVRGSAR
jgi:hypothetical protein